MKRTIIEKVYNIKYIKTTEREKYEARIERLERAFQIVCYSYRIRTQPCKI